ncbi:MAG TPA: hypothetical protein PLB62_16460, partial [Candidatus Sumerlaeota bacterium]|nr:hypothetical protein [Candidatus Sumerlaeota bacterium]
SKDFIVQGTGRWTKKFSEAPEGRGQSMVGNTPESDYLTLAEAAADFNGFAGGCTGNWTLWIASDLTEQASVAFGNSVPAPYRVTVRPLPGISPSVLFTQNTVPAIPGHLIIGAADPGDPSSLVKTDRFFINGCSDDSFSTKNLTILNRDDIQIDDSRLVVVIGDSDNFTIKNSILFNRSLSNAENGCIAMDFMSRNDGIISYIPDESSVENCVINALGGSPVTGRFGIGVRQSGLGAIPSGEAQTDLAVNDCEINARYAGILLGQTAGGSIHGNTIRLDQFAADTHIRGIWLQSAHATSGWSLDISGNRIDKLINVDTGITAIDLGGETYADKHDSIWFNVYNNMICGFNFTSGSPVPNVYYRGIRYDGGSDFVVPIHFNCYYNSLYLPHFDNLSYTAGDETSRRAAFAIGGPLSQS